MPVNDYIADNILIADMNHDVMPEVIAGNNIFNAATGNLLLDMSVMSGLTYGKRQQNSRFEHQTAPDGQSGAGR